MRKEQKRSWRGSRRENFKVDEKPVRGCFIDQVGALGGLISLVERLPRPTCLVKRNLAPERAVWSYWSAQDHIGALGGPR